MPCDQIFEEFSKHGDIEELAVCENLGDHFIGHVYVKFSSEEQAEACLKGIQGRFFAGQQLLPQYSPVTDFKEARCRQFEESTCSRGGYCMASFPPIVHGLLK